MGGGPRQAARQTGGKRGHTKQEVSPDQWLEGGGANSDRQSDSQAARHPRDQVHHANLSSDQLIKAIHHSRLEEEI